MRSSLVISFLAIWSIVVLGTIGGEGCANIIPLEGGLKDTLPPVLIRANPHDSTLHFTGNRISLVFDEYVNLDNNDPQAIIISPVPKVNPNFSRKLQTVNIRLRDSLEANTTYTINFGSTIRDVNENNPYSNYTYVFSTGDYFDSLTLRGNILVAETGEVDTLLRVMLHRDGSDSNVIRSKPRYVTRTDKKGNFEFHNIAPGTYYVYGIKDESGQYRYLNSEQEFAFADSAVVVGQSNKEVQLYAYSVPKKDISTSSSTNDRTPRNAADRRLKFNANFVDGKQDLLTPLIFKFETPLKNFDSSKVRFASDSAFTPVSSYYWQLDSTRQNLSLHTTWKESTQYHLILEKDFATDTLGFQLLRGDTINFDSKRMADYGKLTIRFKNLDLSKNPVLQFVENSAVKNSFPLTSINFSQPLFLPGEYQLRILEDRNGNGKWDAGVFFNKHIQPELVRPIQRKVSVKAGLDIPIEIDVTAPPAAETPPSFGPGSNRPTNNTTPANPNRALKTGGSGRVRNG